MKIDSELKIHNIAGEKVIILPVRNQEEKTRIISMNESSEWLWNYLTDKEFVMQDVCDALYGQYDMSRNEAIAEAESWVSMMKSCGLIKD